MFTPSTRAKKIYVRRRRRFIKSKAVRRARPTEFSCYLRVTIRRENVPYYLNTCTCVSECEKQKKKKKN